MADIEQKIIITTETNADETSKKLDNLVDAQDEISTTQSKATEVSKTNTKALKENGKSLLDNGGAMGILNALTDGYAQVVKDIVEASQLFTKAKKADTIATEVQAAATTKVSVATAIWNAILALNPIILIVAGVTALIAGLGYLALAFYDNKKAVEAVNNALDSAILKHEALNKSVSQLNSDMQSLNEVEIARAKALGATSEEIDKMTLKQKSLNKELLNLQAKEAYKGLLEAQQLLRNANQTEDEDAIKKAQEYLKERNKTYTEANEAFNKSIDEETIARLDIQAKALEKEKALLQKAIDEREAYNKQRIALEKKLLQDIQNLQDKSEEQKLARQKQRDLDEIKTLEQKGIDVRKLLQLNTEKYNILEDELKSKRAQEIIEADKLRDEELRNADDKRRKEQNERDAEDGRLALEQAKYFSDEKIRIAEVEAEHQKKIESLKRDVLTSGLDLVKNLFEKNKKIQKAILITQGIIGLTDITRDTIRGVTAELAKGVPGIPGAILIGAKGAISAAGIIASTAKGLKALGGGGGISSDGGGGSASGGGVSAAPQVQFQGSSENQISNAVNQSQQNIQVTVLEKDISNAQSNVKALVNENSL